MKKIIVSIVIFSFLNLIGCSSSQSTMEDDEINNDSYSDNSNTGAEVFIIVSSGEEFSGELLTVSDSTMILCEEYEADENDLSNLDYPIFFLENHKIKVIVLRDSNFGALGIILGGMAGSAIGGAIGSKSGKKKKSGEFSFRILDFGNAGTGCCLGGALGVLLGLIIGNYAQDEEVIYEYANSVEYDFTQLNIYSRYGDKEPDYLKEIR